MTTPINQPETREIPPNLWTTFLDEFTRENRGTHALVEVLGSDLGRVVLAEDRPFDGAAADTRDGERTVWISLGVPGPEYLTHGIHSATLIRVVPPTDALGSVLEIEATDGSRTIVELTKPGSYELPEPGS
jgi:hypothetical protein